MASYLHTLRMLLLVFLAITIACVKDYILLGECKKALTNTINNNGSIHKEKTQNKISSRDDYANYIGSITQKNK